MMKTVSKTCKTVCSLFLLALGIAFLFPLCGHATDYTKDTADGYAFVADGDDESEYTIHDNKIPDGQLDEFIVYCYDSEKQQPPKVGAVINDNYPLYLRTDIDSTTAPGSFTPETYAAITAALLAGYPNDALGFLAEAGLTNTKDDNFFARKWTQLAVWYIENYNDKTSFYYQYFQKYQNFIDSDNTARIAYVGLLKDYIDQQITNTVPTQSVQFQSVDGTPITFSAVAGDLYETNLFKINAFYAGTIQIPSLSDSLWVEDTESHKYTNADDIPVNEPLKFVTTDNNLSISSISAKYTHNSVRFYYYRHIEGSGDLDDAHTEFQDLVRATRETATTFETVAVTMAAPTVAENLPVVKVKKTYTNTDASTVYPTLQFSLTLDDVLVGQATLTGGAADTFLSFTEAFKTQLKAAVADDTFALVLSERQDAAPDGNWVYDAHTYPVTLTKTADGWLVAYENDVVPTFENTIKTTAAAPAPAPTSTPAPVTSEAPGSTPAPTAVSVAGKAPATGDTRSLFPYLCLMIGSSLALATAHKKKQG